MTRQLTHRLKGSLRSEAGAPIASATIRAEVISGFRGEPFAGVKDLSQIEALSLLSAGKKSEAFQARSVALGLDVPPSTRVAAGEIALLLQQPALARTLFNQVASKDPKHARALVGLTGAALMERDWESAGKLMWNARDLAPKDQRQALAAAISDLQPIARVQ